MNTRGEYLGRAVSLWWISLWHRDNDKTSSEDVAVAAKEFDALSLLGHGATDIKWPYTISIHIEASMDLTNGIGQRGHIKLAPLGM